MLQGAVIGFGGIIQKSHLPAFADSKLRTKLKIKAAVELNKRNRIESGKKYRDLNFYASFEEMLDNEKIDFVDIATPPVYHKEYIEKAISRNLNIICEKPFVLNTKEALYIYDKLSGYNGTFVVCHQYKYSPLWREFKKAIDTAPKTKKMFLQFNVIRSKADKGIEMFRNVWRIDKNISGGGILADTGIHYIYLSLWLMGKPRSVWSSAKNITHHNYKVEDTAVVILEFDRGIAQINLTWGGNRRHNSAFLSSGNVSLQYLGGRKLIKYINDKEEILEVPDPSDKNTYIDLYVELFNEFYNMATRKSTDKSAAEEALMSIKIMELAYKSSEKNKTMAIINE
ncbi:Gfo/Idh/MocA family protein [Melioribacter sp. Ez-97]|uniref:Gfo/Idh/MocA family protein n=1 Tax=Melioribacter sp. Ez-97 TaxID=3423434 RepID=UPI003ED987AB